MNETNWITGRNSCFRSRPHVAGYFRKRRFFSSRSHRFRTPKTEVLLSRQEIFENGDLLYSCGRAKTEVFKYDDVMPRFHACSSAHTIQKRYVWTQIFFNTEEKVSVFKNYPATCGLQIRFETATSGRIFFLNTEIKISVFENTRLSVDGA